MRLNMTAYRFTVDFDAEAGVWYVCDSTLPGLHTEAETLDALVGKLRDMLPDLLAAIDEPGGTADAAGDISFDVILHTNTQARQPAA
jgi:predicted RNase H-like HicB family nuclease